MWHWVKYQLQEAMVFELFCVVFLGSIYRLDQIEGNLEHIEQVQRHIGKYRASSKSREQ